MHVEQEGGPSYRSKYQIRFPRDANGKYCPASPTNPEPIFAPIRNKPSFKYCQQARFSLGCAAVKLSDGRIVGKRTIVFDCTGQRLVSIGEYDRRVREEINRVKTLKIDGRRSKWITEQRVTKHFHDEDNINCLPMVGNNTKTHQTMSEHGIRTIGHLKALLSDQTPPNPWD